MKYTVPSKYLRLLAAGLMPLLFISCATPNLSKQSVVGADTDEFSGGISSSDIRTVSSQMAPALLGVPELANVNPGPARIAMAPMKNSSRFIIDMDIFMKRLRLDLNRYALGRVRFYSQNNAQATRSTVLQERNEIRLKEGLELFANDLKNSAFYKGLRKPVTVAVIPALQSNLVNMNGDSFVAMLRSEVSAVAGDKIQFLMPGVMTGADYYLTGQFIAESMKQEAIINLAEYIQIAEQRLREGKSLATFSEEQSTGTTVAVNTGNQIITGTGNVQRGSILERIAASSALQVEPNVTRYLNAMIAKADTKAVAFEKQVTVTKKITSGMGNANYVLSGEISGLSKRANGKQSDYILITVQLVDPETNEMLWEDGYEVKKLGQTGVVYQ